ncbi:Pseudaminic acid synthase protein [Marine Group I thaumarchaeote SCGC AAA799-O18]|jgi:sialic acid synthase SpsE|nr:Pseudaminic acid synthase protein [Marine Group I thaumarchaeote SCGC AAA799-O18]
MTLKSFIVAEIASNWEGNLSKAKKLIQESKNAGANAVKFQMWRANDLYNNKHPNWNFIKKSEITFEKAKKLKQIADKTGIEFFCSAFYPEAIKFLEKLKVRRYKIASRTCLLKDPYSIDTLLAKARTKKPVIISMGMGGNKNKIKDIFKKNKKTFCYCVSKYPTSLNEINWNEAKKFDGFSDHTLGIIAPIIFTVIKKQQKAEKIIIEKHVKLKNSKGPDASTSITTKELEELISQIKIIEKTKFEKL